MDVFAAAERAHRARSGASVSRGASALGPLAVRWRLRRSRRSLIAQLCAVAVLAVVAAHHAGAASESHEGMGGMGHGVAAMVMCLGVLGLAAVALAARPRLGRLLVGPARPSVWRLPVSVLEAFAPPLARDGPALHVVLSVWRR